MDWYKIDLENEVDSPALLVYPDRIQYNIELVKSMIGDCERLRPHVKTHKTKEITQMQLKAGISKFKCATIGEADMLGDSKAPDVLLAYPLVEPKLQKFANLVKKYPQTRFSAIVDHIKAADNLSACAVKNKMRVNVFVDLNVGMNRTGVLPGEPALQLYKHCTKLEGLAIKGFHAYDGHVRERDLDQRKQVCDLNFEPIATMIAQLQEEGFIRPLVIIGGSPSFPIYAKYPEVECSPGTFALWDKGYANALPEQGFLPAAVLMVRIVSLPTDRHICIDLGYKAIASENSLENRVVFLNKSGLEIVSHSEEHMVLDAGKNHGFMLGDVLYALPIHICPTVAMYKQLMVVKSGKVIGEWKVVAGKK